MFVSHWSYTNSNERICNRHHTKYMNCYARNHMGNNTNWYIPKGQDTRICLYELELRGLENKYVTIHIYKYVQQHTHRRVPVGDNNSRPNDFVHCNSYILYDVGYKFVHLNSYNFNVKLTNSLFYSST